MKDFSLMSDYQLCYHKKTNGAIQELWKRYNPLIYKYAHTFHSRINKSVPIEDIIQDFNFLFVTAIHKINTKRIKNKKYFKVILYVPYFFRAYQKVLYHHYKEDITSCDYDLYNHSQEQEFDSHIFDTIKKVLSDGEYQIILNFYKLNYTKTEIAKSLGISNSLLTYKINNILEKLKYSFTNERLFLLSE
jgi:RNA polymerase sigma factor (sigma-70 family)